MQVVQSVWGNGCTSRTYHFDLGLMQWVKGEISADDGPIGIGCESAEQYNQTKELFTALIEGFYFY